MKRKEKIKEFSRFGRKERLHTAQKKQDKLRQLRFDLAAGKVKNIREIREIKKDIARIKTLMQKDSSPDLKS